MTNPPLPGPPRPARPSHVHCREFSRSSVLHRAAAEAGRGLPAIEPGMPLPAGTGLDRRRFLSRAAGLGLVVYGAAALSPRMLDEGIARAATEAAGQRALVSIFLPGGADGLNILYPAGDPAYHRLRPSIGLKADQGIAFREDSRLHWHPSLAPVARELYAKGKVTVFPAIGYAHPDQSHFTSRHYWEVGALDPQLRTGWLGRYLDVHGSADNPLQGLSLDDQLQPPLASARTPISTISSPEDYRFGSHHVWDDVSGLLTDSVGELGRLRLSPDPTLADASHSAYEADQLRRRLGRFIDRDGHAKITVPRGIKYPDGGFARKLSGLAAMLDAGFPIRAVALTAPGSYDTHADESGALANGLTQVADALVAFQHDLEARGLGRRVATLVWSEFGRRAAENASQGTDHGAAGVGFLIGTGVSGRMIGEFPGFGKGLDGDGNVRATSDYRSVYASLLEQWYRVDAAAILPDAKKLARYRLLKA